MTSAAKLRPAFLIISETASKDPTSDKAIPALQEVLENEGSGKWDAPLTAIVPDDVMTIQRTITQWTDCQDPVHLILTSGGTGFTQKDVTPETWYACRVARHHTLPVAGVRNRTLILTLPGSPKGAKENLQSVIRMLPHACQQAAGADSRSLHAGGLKKLEQEAGVKAGPAAATSTHQNDHHHDHSHGHSHGHGHGHGGHQIPRAHTSPEDRPQLSNDPKAGPTRRYRESPYPMKSVGEALSLIAQHTPAARPMRVPLSESVVGSVLAEDVTARESVPAFKASIVDGYAIVASNHVLVPSTKGIFPVVGVSHAQAGQASELGAGEVARITTGAPLPPGATAVVMVEDTVLRSMTDDGKEEHEVEILTDAIEPGENVREVGSDVKAGDIIMRKGEGISSAGGELGLLASVGTQEVAVYRKPVIGVLSTGDEIVPYDRPGDLRLGEVRDTNRPTLLTAVRASGFEAVDLGIASDKPGALESTLRDAMRQVDVIITSGGVSMGELDLLKPTIERSLGGTIHFGRVSMKPGKPTTFATIPVKDNAGGPQTKLIFSLPGNPASAVVTYHLFVLPSVHQMSGVQPAGLPEVKVVLETPVKCDSKRAEYHRVMVTARNDGRLYATSTGGQRSSRIGSFKGANALLCLPAKDATLQQGDILDALLMGQVAIEAPQSL